MRILHYLRWLRSDQGGPVRAIVDLSGELAQAGHEVTVVTQDAYSAPAEWTGPDANPRVVELGTAALPGELFGRRQLRRVHELVEAHDVVHLHQLWLPTTAQIAFVSRRCHTPYVVSLRGMLDDWCVEERRLRKRVHLEVIGRRLLEGAAFVHCTAEGELQQARQWFPDGRAAVIPNLLGLEPFRELPSRELAFDRFGLKADVPRLLFLSRLHPKKNVESLVHAVRDLARGGRPHQLLIAGSGDEAYVQKLHRLCHEYHLGATGWVRFLGFVEGSTKLSLYRAADLFVLPTHQENFGFVLFEALLCETPVVTTFGVDTWPELQASGGARIAPSEDFRKTIQALTREPSRLSEMGRAGALWAAEYLDPQRVVARFDDLYRQATRVRS